MVIADLSSYKELYLETAKEYSDALLKNYIKISQNSLDKAALENMYISAHSLKSESQVMGYTKIETLSSMIEKVIKNILDNKIQITDDLMIVIENAIDNVKLSLRNIEIESKSRTNIGAG